MKQTSSETTLPAAGTSGGWFLAPSGAGGAGIVPVRDRGMTARSQPPTRGGAF